MQLQVVNESNGTFSVAGMSAGANPAFARASSRSRLNFSVPVESIVLVLEMWQVREIDAIFVQTDEHDVFHAYVVTREHTNAVYDKVVAAEERVRQMLPRSAMHIHVRAHQGRPPKEAVPLQTAPLFIR